MKHRHRFGNVDVDPLNLRLTVDGQVRPLEPKSFRLLQFLIENRGRVVTKDEILQAVWAGTHVSDNALTRAIAQLRKAIGDDAKESRYIETIPTVGYRFVAVVDDGRSVLAPPSPPSIRPPRLGSKRSILIAVIVLLALAGVAAWRPFFGKLAKTPNVTVVPVQFSTSAGLDVGASFSPYGGLVAYASDKTGTFEIYVRSFETGAKELQLTDDGKQNFSPAFSPDGRAIAYASLNSPGVFRVPALGGSPQRLTTFGAQPVWSPDGTTIVFLSNASSSLSVTDYYYPHAASLWTVPASGGEPRPITAASGAPEGDVNFPSWSPDGREIRFVVDFRSESSVWAYGIASGSFRKLFGSTTLPFSNATFAPDDRRMWFVKWRLNGDIGIWQLDLDTDLKPIGEAVALYQSSYSPRDIAISRDGRRLAFTAVQSTSMVLSRRTSDKEAPVAFTRDVSYRYSLVRSSPDGTRVSYTSIPRNGPYRTWVAKDGSQPLGIGREDASQLFGTVSLNNDRVFFIETHGSQSKIVLHSLIDGAYTELSGVPPGTTQVSFSPDGAMAAYHVDSDDRQQVYLQDVKSGERRVLLSAPEDVGFPRFSRDGSLILVQITHRDNGGNDLGVIPAHGGPLEIVLPSDQRNFAGGWMPDNDHILFAGFRDAVWNIYSTSRSTKKVERLTDYRMARTYVRYPDWLVDGRVVYEFNEVKGNIFIANLR